MGNGSGGREQAAEDGMRDSERKRERKTKGEPKIFERDALKEGTIPLLASSAKSKTSQCSYVPLCDEMEVQRAARPYTLHTAARARSNRDSDSGC